MKLLSYNMRGLGRKEKIREVRELINKLRIEICCLQETKMEVMNTKVCRSIWGSRPFDWSHQDAERNAGGILTIWNIEVFQKLSEWSCRGMLVVNGLWVEDGSRCTIINVYAPNNPAQRGVLWETIEALADQIRTDKVCIICDFNAIREVNERIGRSSFCDKMDMDNFNKLIDGSDLTEIPLVGRSYTWYRPDGSCKSKLDRLLVYSNWLSTWPNVIVKGGKRSFLDHIPIFIEGHVKDWGPKPFKFFNQWIQHPSYKPTMEEAWKGTSRQGWTGYILKEKLKDLKGILKSWSKRTFEEMEHLIEEKKGEIEKLDLVDDAFCLSEEEAARRKEIMGELQKEASWNEKQLFQKSRIK
ncbi:hypothetical protein ACS0TY_026721 [Phlomoides rotata]